jgi:hypothetical protein
VGVEPTGDGVTPPPAGFEDRGNHRTACASVFVYRLQLDTECNRPTTYMRPTTYADSPRVGIVDAVCRIDATSRTEEVQGRSRKTGRQLMAQLPPVLMEGNQYAVCAGCGGRSGFLLNTGVGCLRQHLGISRSVFAIARI